MEWFSGLKKWVRVYICFLIPLLATAICYAYLKFLAGNIIVCFVVFVMLPIFISSEERVTKKKREELLFQLIRIKKLIAISKVSDGKTAQGTMSSQANPASALYSKTQTAQLKAQAIKIQHNKESSDFGKDFLEQAARERANKLIISGNKTEICKRIDMINQQIDDEGVLDESDPVQKNRLYMQQALIVERDLLLAYLNIRK